ncbi:hypothetical protein EMQ25_10890 [Arsenicitalea aurantiaca]|uniref:EAL domain-containing protein n=1 Tax=Arsenicitalea aurantiaca TaxID=1783274 RepID=A0A433XB92_9HYPH|nr:hypothetical protein [Arsenicitalea aurantiaca]RUT31349.1 hypothetical protein EMQ25_10890 [Arsenicitalea aurantiaca]
MGRFKEAVSSLGSLVSAILNAEDEAPAPRRQGSGTQERAGKTGFENRLRQLTRENEGQSGGVVAGSLELVGLEDVREALGPRWAELAVRATDLAEAVIGARLGADDFQRRHGDFTFLICFARATRTEAEARSREIAAAVKARLAEAFPEIEEVLSVEQFVSEVDRATLRDAGGSLIEALAGSLQTMRFEAEQAARRYRASLIRNFNLVFAPGVHARKQTTVFNRAVLETTAGCTTLAQFQAIADPDQLSSTLAEMDCLVLTRALEALHRIVRQKGGGTILVVPVSYGTLANPSYQKEYVRLLGMIPEAYRKLVVLEICALPTGATRRRANLMVLTLRPFVKWIAIEVGTPAQQAEFSGLDGVWAFSLNLAGATVSEPGLAARLRAFVQQASASQMSTLAHNANSMGLAVLASEAGFTYIDGPAIHAAMATPKIGSFGVNVPPPPATAAVAGRRR